MATLRRLARNGRLAGAYKIGSRWRFVRETIELLRGQIAWAAYQADIGRASLLGDETA